MVYIKIYNCIATRAVSCDSTTFFSITTQLKFIEKNRGESSAANFAKELDRDKFLQK